jgi:hypothetical protein
MEHPLLGNLDEYSIDELNSKISELNKKLNIAMSTGNAHLCNQLRMAIESFRNKYHEKVRNDYEKKLADAKIDSSKIDIQ